MTELGLGDFYPEANTTDSRVSEPLQLKIGTRTRLHDGLVAMPETRTNSPSWLQAIEGAAAEKPAIAQKEIAAYNSFLVDMGKNVPKLVGKSFPDLTLGEVAEIISNQIQVLLEQRGLQMQAVIFDGSTHGRASFFDNDCIEIPLQIQDGPYYPLIRILVEDGWLPRPANAVSNGTDTVFQHPINQHPPSKGRIFVQFSSDVGPSNYNKAISRFSNLD